MCNPNYGLDKQRVSMLVKILRNITNSVSTETQSKNKLKSKISLVILTSFSQYQFINLLKIP